MEVSKLDAAAQRVRSQFIVIDDGGVHRYPVELRFAYPSELDLMARIAGMRLRERWGGWDRRPFTSESANHVSVYEPDATTSCDIDQKRETRASESSAGKTSSHVMES